MKKRVEIREAHEDDLKVVNLKTCTKNELEETVKFLKTIIRSFEEGVHIGVSAKDREFLLGCSKQHLESALARLRELELS